MLGGPPLDESGRRGVDEKSGMVGAFVRRDARAHREGGAERGIRLSSKEGLKKRHGGERWKRGKRRIITRKRLRTR